MDKIQGEMIRKEIEKLKAEFAKEMEKIIPKLKKELEEKETILIPVKDLKKEMGKFGIMNDTRFFYAAKLCLWDNGIYIEGKKKEGESALLMRNRNPDDKFFKKSEGEEGEKEEKITRDILTIMTFGKPPNSYDFQGNIAM
jgi:hypothetical protein